MNGGDPQALLWRPRVHISGAFDRRMGLPLTGLLFLASGHRGKATTTLDDDQPHRHPNY